MDGEYYKRFMLHYNFPPFSVGEVQFMRGPGRREIGHGALAERALAPVLPAEEKFPYTIRVVSDILEIQRLARRWRRSAAASLALMDAGVPINAPVAGIAMGLVMERRSGKYAILTDIAGAEDHYGDMDFKVAGTRRASPRCRWTSRSPASPPTSCARRWSRRARGRLHILGKMAETLGEPRGQHVAVSRRASSPSRSRSTRSATSSDRAAR